jgi:2',3'-cyclic-nucleotide 2'-phosphodiesterase (5'-nucleotidase family)
MTFKNRGLAAACLFTALAIPVCLSAQTSGDAQITILQTTDLHHHANGADHVGLDVDPINGTSLTGAYARISAYVKYVRSNTNHPVVLVDSGDWTMGTLYDLTLASRPMGLMFLDLMNYDCVTLGNHEFDYTPKGLAQILGAAQSTFAFRTPIVASNMNLGGSADLGAFVGNGKAIQTTRIQDLANGLRVGYIGLMGKGAAVDAPASAPVSFTDFSAGYAAIQSMVDGLRNNQGVQVVIVLSHSGTDARGTSGEDVALAAHVRGIDVIASGHTHTPLASAHAVTNGGWTTQIIDAGAFGTNVSRIDLTYHASGNSTTMDASSNLAMTDPGLTAIRAGLVADPAIVAVVAAVDQQLNAALSSFFTQAFPDYDRTSIAKGIYHPVGSAAQNMVSNGLDPVPSPNGLGDLAADSVRSTPNGIITQTLAAVGGIPTNLPGYDFTPFQAGLVATGVLRGKLQSGVPLSFADVYNVLPLGISPDFSQALPVGYPMVSAYLELADVKTLCALQLVTQSNLAPADYYLNLSGLKYGLKTTESYTYFKYATAAGVLQLASQRAAAGSIPALQALGALSTFAQDRGGALLAAYGNDNPFAGALVKLNDANPTLAQIGANLGVVGQVATAAAVDAAAGTNSASALVVSKAVAAIDTVSGFAVTDASNTGLTTDISGTSRVRVATDLFAVLALGAVQAQFGVTVTVYKSATGPATLSGADLSGILANRINAAPAGPGVQELKEWMALLSYLQSGLKGTISPAYASSSDFTQFGSAGAAVQTRNASYPLASIGQFIGTLSSLGGNPPCASIGTPVVTAVTSATYGTNLSAAGTIIVWGTGFSAGGGNSIQLAQAGADPISMNATSGTYFWDLSANQINATLPSGIAARQWLLSVKNACGVTSANFPVTLQ